MKTEVQLRAQRQETVLHSIFIWDFKWQICKAAASNLNLKEKNLSSWKSVYVFHVFWKKSNHFHVFWRTVFCLYHMVKTNERVKKEEPVIWPSLNSVMSDNSSIIVLLTLTQRIFSFISHTSFFAFSCHQQAFGYHLLSHCIKHLYCREKCSTSKRSHNCNTIFLLRK